MRHNRFALVLTTLLVSFLALCANSPSWARHFKLRASGEGPENHFGVALSFPYEGSESRYGRILRDQAFGLGATWFIVSHWDTPLSWAAMQGRTDVSGRPVFSGVDNETLEAFKECHEHGIKTIVTLSFSNPLFYPEWLYTPDRPSSCDGKQRWCFYVRSADEPGGRTSYDDEDPDIGHIETTYICAEWLGRFLEYCKKVAGYYGQNVDGWMVWEEENWVPTGSSDGQSCLCKSEFWRPYPPYAGEEDWRKMTRLYAEMLIHTAPLMKRLTPHAKLLFGATCGLDVPYIEAVVQEMAALGATEEFFRTNIDGYGFHGFRSGVWRSADERYRGAPELEVPSPHRYSPDDEDYGLCSMFTHYASLGQPTQSFLGQVADLRARIAAVTGQEPDSIELYNTEDCAPFHYNDPCEDQMRGFVRMAKYLSRSNLTCYYANVHVTHWQLQEGDAGPTGADYGLINRTHTNSGCTLTPDRPYMLPELRREAYYSFQIIATIFDKTLSYLDPRSIGVTVYDRAPDEMSLPINYQPTPERSDVATGNQEITVLLHVPKAGATRQAEILISDWRMTDFPLVVGSSYQSVPGLTHVMTDESANPNTMLAWLEIDLSSPELHYDMTVPPEVWEVSTLPQGDLHTLDISCPERPLTYGVDTENPTTIIIEKTTVSDYVNVIEIAPAQYPSFKVAGTLDSYLNVNPDGSVRGNITVLALPYGPSFIDSIKAFYSDIDLSVALNDRGEGDDPVAGDGIFTAQLTAPGTEPGPASSLIADGARHPIVLAAGISQNAMFAGEGGSFIVTAYALDGDNPSDPGAVVSCAARVPGTALNFPMVRTPGPSGGIDSYKWSTKVQFEDLSGVAKGLYLVEVIATDSEGLRSVPWPHIPTGDGTYIEGFYLNLRVKGRSGNFVRCWPELRLN